MGDAAAGRGRCRGADTARVHAARSGACAREARARAPAVVATLWPCPLRTGPVAMIYDLTLSALAARAVLELDVDAMLESVKGSPAGGLVAAASGLSGAPGSSSASCALRRPAGRPRCGPRERPDLLRTPCAKKADQGG